MVLLLLLIEFKKVCEENNIWYSLAYGTMLGAVREGGFIDWDEDADVYLMLPDKERFREAFYASDHGNIYLKNCSTNKKCLQSHDSLKLIGSDVHLDIYLLVGAPSKRISQLLYTNFSYYSDRIVRSKYVDLRKCNTAVSRAYIKKQTEKYTLEQEIKKLENLSDSQILNSVNFISEANKKLSYNCSPFEICSCRFYLNIF